jgi:hypothetical protein
MFYEDDSSMERSRPTALLFGRKYHMLNFGESFQVLDFNQPSMISCEDFMTAIRGWGVYTHARIVSQVPFAQTTQKEVINSRYSCWQGQLNLAACVVRTLRSHQARVMSSTAREN